MDDEELKDDESLEELEIKDCDTIVFVRVID